MAKKTYIFFEPWNKKFFPAIAKAYSEKYINKLEGIAKTFEASCKNNYPPDKVIDQVVETYGEKLPFPACDYIMNINCASNLCGDEKIAVITDRQEKQLIEAIDKVTGALEKSNIVRNSIIGKLKSRHLWHDKIEVITIKEKHGREKYLYYYIAGINGRKKPEKEAEAFFVYVCAVSGSDYNYINHNPKTELKPLLACNEFQKIV